ncbi:MAG TPA: prepilin-type N-terminal cleavage/methylation domain-containing protein [Gemmatimonadales bacterium]|jgi:general secretion pathway protein G|nr:prepilin-type N-terminal cleavage/methylation domain-containing protein [Gemmatimonadales bacterium]
METKDFEQELARLERRRRQAGMTIIELLAVLAIVSSLASIAIPKYHAIADTARVSRAIGDIEAIQISLDTRDTLPDNLLSLNLNLTDPWGNPYVYVKFPHGTPRVDAFGVQLNTTYDLYSIGPDGSTSTSTNASSSIDDVIRANDGGYIGSAGKF